MNLYCVEQKRKPDLVNFGDDAASRQDDILAMYY
ncbi:uncharacterized protein METZ01_LOCUS201402 [marine metagenome]|uniref:Uncharacterized protein n=1 Tax=marine metagenome TaxID=408172 RepID=A0A382ECY6_9ZZZZ